MWLWTQVPHRADTHLSLLWANGIRCPSQFVHNGSLWITKLHTPVIFTAANFNLCAFTLKRASPLGLVNSCIPLRMRMETQVLEVGSCQWPGNWASQLRDSGVLRSVGRRLQASYSTSGETGVTHTPGTGGGQGGRDQRPTKERGRSNETFHLHWPFDLAILVLGIFSKPVQVQNNRGTGF